MERQRVGVVGLGYVGLPLALAIVDAGHEVVGVDVDEERVNQLRDGRSYVTDVPDDAIDGALQSGFEPTTDYDELADVSHVSVCVPTPLRKTGQPDVSYVLDATERLADAIDDGTTVVLESTVYPGATEEIIAETFADRDFAVGEDVFVAFSPERVDPGNEEYGIRDIPKVLGGVTDGCGDRAQALYDTVFGEIVRVDSCTEAELVKLLENTFRSVNIGLINEMARIADTLDADIWSVVDAAATKPFGFMPFYPGPGLGGHCIPVDPMYLSWKANQSGVETKFIDLADKINRSMPTFVVSKVTDLLNWEGIPLSEADVLVVGVAYKADVSDVRESPALDIMELLANKGASVSYHDPFVPAVETTSESYESVALTPERLASTDCVVITTEHTQFDIPALVEQTTLVFDTRNATAGLNAAHVHRL